MDSIFPERNSPNDVLGPRLQRGLICQQMRVIQFQGVDDGHAARPRNDGPWSWKEQVTMPGMSGGVCDDLANGGEIGVSRERFVQQDSGNSLPRTNWIELQRCDDGP